MVEINEGRKLSLVPDSSWWPTLAETLCACVGALFCKIKANLIVCGIILPGATISARYTTYADDVSTLVLSNTQIDQVGRELRRYETVSGTKINRDKSILACG